MRQYWGMIGAVSRRQDLGMIGAVLPLRRQYCTFLAYLFTYMLCDTTFLGQCLGMIGAVSYLNYAQIMPPIQEVVTTQGLC
jgi:hypothetical protein